MSDPEPRSRRPWRTDAEWQRLRHRMDASVDLAPPRRWQRYAAGLAAASIVGVASYFVLRSAPAAPVEWHVVSTPPAGRAVIRLEDSTVVTLGPATTLRYALSTSRRDVVLDGLADFKVTHDPARPFVVRARNTETSDLGTEFVVRSYRSDSLTTIAVSSGVVRVSGGDSASGVTLHSGEVATVDRAGLASAAPSQSVSGTSLWMQGGLAFQNRPLGEVTEELGRWFDVDMRVADSVLARKRITATYAAPSLNGVLASIAATTGARYVRSGRTITWRRSGR